jgi:hypothetical protein
VTAIEHRLFSGDHTSADTEWLAFLDEVFRDVTLSGFVEHGMSAEDARRLVNLLAMTRRVTQEAA